MKILEVVHGLRTASGVATFVRELSDALFAQGECVAIAMCRPETDNWMPPKGGEAVVTLSDALSKGGWNVVHVHGLWDREIRLAASWAIKHRVPLVWSPHGMLAPWALKFHWWKKCLPWHAYLKRLLLRASAFHVTSEKEAEWVRALGFTAPTILLPLGTHVVGEKVGGLEGWKVRGLEGWKVGEKVGGLEGWKVGGLEGEKVGGLEGWKVGGLEGGKVGGLEGSDNHQPLTPNNPPTTTWFDLSDASSIWNMRPVVIGKSPAVSDKKAVKECFRNFGTVINRADGVKVVFPAASAGKMLYQSGMEIGRVVSSFKRLFEGARLAWREREEKMDGHKYHFNVKSYANYVNKFSLDGELYFIRFTIREIGNALGVHASTISDVSLYGIKTDGASADSILENPEDGLNAPFADKIPFSRSDVNGRNKTVKFTDWKLTAFFKTTHLPLNFGCGASSFAPVAKVRSNGANEVRRRVLSREPSTKLSREQSSMERAKVEKKSLPWDGLTYSSGGAQGEAFFSPAASVTTILFVGRIHPVKGLENLVRAVARVVADRTDLHVRLVGTDDAGFQAQLEKLIGELGIGEYIVFPGPRYEAELTQEFLNCDFSILPSFTENFGGVVIDSLAAGRPVIASRATPWEALEKEKCGLWVENSPEELARAIRKMMDMSLEERRVMGERGRRFVEANYTWTAVAEKMRKAYAGLEG